MSKKLGILTAQYRWFAVVYILGMFFLLPGVFVALTFIDPTGIVMYTFLAICAVSILMILTINYFQSHERYHKTLPLTLKNWKFLPEPMRSQRDGGDVGGGDGGGNRPQIPRARRGQETSRKRGI